MLIYFTIDIYQSKTWNITLKTCEYIIELFSIMKKYMNTFVCYLIHNESIKLN
jgi:hypothetical protein